MFKRSMYQFEFKNQPNNPYLFHQSTTTLQDNDYNNDHDEIPYDIQVHNFDIFIMKLTN